MLRDELGLALASLARASHALDSKHDELSGNVTKYVKAADQRRSGAWTLYP
jgi:hypothetical protein